MSEIKYEILDWSKFYETSRKLAENIKNSCYDPKVVIGLARGGWVLSRVLCDYLGVNELICLRKADWKTFHKIYCSTRKRQKSRIEVEGRKMLMVYIKCKVEDIVNTKKYIESLKSEEIRTLTFNFNKDLGYTPDYYGEKRTQSLIFPWEQNRFIKKSKRIKDIDNSNP